MDSTTDIYGNEKRPPQKRLTPSSGIGHQDPWRVRGRGPGSPRCAQRHRGHGPRGALRAEAEGWPKDGGPLGFSPQGVGGFWKIHL